MEGLSKDAELSGASMMFHLVRSITAALKEAGKVEIVLQVMDLQSMVIALMERSQQLAAENEALRKALSVKSSQP